MAKNVQNPGGMKNAPGIQPDSEQDQFLADLKVAKEQLGRGTMEEIRGARDTYLEWKGKEDIALRKAIDTDGWTIPKEERQSALLEFLVGYRQLGSDVFKVVPKKLHSVVRVWVEAQKYMRIYERYTQWLLDENPGVAREMASTPVAAASISPIMMGPPSGEAPVIALEPRVEVPRPPRPEISEPSVPARSEPILESLVSLSDDLFARFLDGGAVAPVVESRSVPRVEVPLEIPIAAPIEAPPETHAEDRVATWSRSLRNTVGRFFGGAPAVPPAVEASPVVRDAVPVAEASRRTAGGLMSVLSRFFGPKVFADVPQYLPESFGDQNARALFQADILDAMEENSAAMKAIAGDPDRIHAANLNAAARLDRAIATSVLSHEAKVEMRDRVIGLQEKYADRTRENMAAQSRELAGLVAQQTRVLEAPGGRGSLAIRLLSNLPFGVGANLTHGVGDFRKRFEGAVSQGGDTGMVARVATVFRETWEEAMRGVRASGSLGDRAMNTAEAVAMIGSAYGVSTAVTALEQVLPSLRSLSESERDEMSLLIAEGRLNVQETVDGVLPRAEQAMKRAA